MAETARSVASWQDQSEASAWFLAGRACSFMARGSSLGSCHETRLLWEEGVKSPATAMNTGSFHHGPQEMVAAGARIRRRNEEGRMGGEDPGGGSRSPERSSAPERYRA